MAIDNSLHPTEDCALGQRLAGKVAIVTGASRGIGLAIAWRLVEEGARVVITARKPEALESAVESLGGSAFALGMPGRTDDESHQEAVVTAAVEVFGAIDILVNNTGINPAAGPTLHTDLDAARKTLEVNVLGALMWTRRAAEHWEGRGGCVVNVASVAGLRPAHGVGFYGVSKAALIALTAQLAAENGPSTRVNAVAPALVRTQFAQPLIDAGGDKTIAEYPLGRLGEPKDVAAAVAFLASADAAWITGQTLVVDGGLTLGGGV